MSGPVDPSVIMPSAKLPKAKSFEHWRNRVVCRLLGRLAREDFDFGFETVCEWMDVGGGRTISSAQAACSAFDIMMATCGVASRVCIQRCEQTDIVLMTIEVPGSHEEPPHRRTRTITIREPKAEPAPTVTRLKRKRA